MSKPRIHLALDMSWTQVETAWRQPASWVGAGYPDVGLFEDVARIAERGLFDLIFFGDSTGIPNTWEGIDRRRRPPRRRMAAAGHEPVDHRDVAGDQPSRFRPDLCLDLHASVLCRATAELARPHHQRPHRVQRHHLAAPRRRRRITASTN